MNVRESCDRCEAASNAAVVNGVRVSKRVMPAYLAARGGDWCETFLVDENVIALSIGDVWGESEERFSTMTRVRATIRDCAFRGLDAAQILAAADAFVCGESGDLYATAFFALLDTRFGTLAFANAGHPSPITVSPDGPALLSDAACDVPLGVGFASSRTLRVQNVAPQTLLVLYTNGVTENDRNRARGERQLVAAATFAYTYSEIPVAYVIEELMFLTGSNRDDASILTASIPRTPPALRSISRRRPRTTGLRRTFAESHLLRIVPRQRSDDELRLTLPRRQRWTGGR